MIRIAESHEAREWKRFVERYKAVNGKEPSISFESWCFFNYYKGSIKNPALPNSQENIYGRNGQQFRTKERTRVNEIK